MMGFMLPAQGVWAEDSETETRLKLLEKKLETMELEKMEAAQNQDDRFAFNLHNLDPSSRLLISGKDQGVTVKYKHPGFEIKSADGLFSTKLVWRAQMRWTYPNNSDPRSVGNFTTRNEASNFELRRVRMKIGGHGYKPWIKYYFEVDLQPSKSSSAGNLGDRSRIIDWRIDVQPWDEFGIRVGQWKINYNRERVDSSGRQTFVERSIVNRIFTIDRQVGIMAQGRLFKKTHADMRYYAGIFNGEGRATNNDDNNMMYMARWQWNFLGRDLKWRQSDVSYHKKPAGSLAFAYAENTSQCTRWSSSGCGSVQGNYPLTGAAVPNSYKIEQWVQEFAFKWQGLAIQQEYHRKDVIDKNVPANSGEFEGMYAQIGYFFHGLFPKVPKELELATRYAFVKAPDTAFPQTLEDERDEYTVALNWFFAGHNNKITVDYSYLTLDDATTMMHEKDNRVRVQWDVSF